MKKAMMFVMALSAFNGVTATHSQQNLIVNGNFDQNDCHQDWCIFNNSNCVKGWTPEPQIQIGYGSVYNECLGKQRVLELAPNKNSCVKQTVKNIQSGIYKLKFEYSARKGRAFNDCQFAVSFNGNNLKTITPNDYKLHTETIEVQVKSTCDGAQLKFCGVGGDNNSYGAIIKSVSLIRASNLPASQNPPPVYNPPVYNPPVYNPPVYNPPSQNVPGIYIDSHSGQCTQKEYQLQGGQIQIDFDYQILSNSLVKDSAIYVTLNGQPIYKVLPCDSGKTIKLQGTLPKGSHILGFCAIGCPKQAYHQAFISNIIIYQKQCVGAWGNDIIVNGGFEQNECKYDWCIWNQQTYLPSKIAGWIPSPQIQVGKGTVYNKALGCDWVTQLDPNANSCIKQKVNLKQGRHLLNFDWANRSGVKAQSNQFEVRINGQVLKKISSNDCQVHKQNIEFGLNSCQQQSWIEFCGTGKSDSFGALIDNVKLFNYQQCGSYKVVKY